MQREDVGSLPVCSQQGQLLGMVTDRDLVLRALARSIDDLSSLTAKDIMSLHPVTITPDMDSHDAALVFSSHRIRRLPVTENEKLVGMLSLGDLASRPVCIDEAGDTVRCQSCPWYGLKSASRKSISPRSVFTLSTKMRTVSPSL